MAPVYLRVRELRDAEGWSRAELAERVRISRAAVDRIEQGTMTGLDVAPVERLADALCLSAAVVAAHERASGPGREAPAKR